MHGPRAQNWNRESFDSCDDQHHKVTVQTEWSHVQGTNYQLQESVEESSKLQPCYMIGHKVYKTYGEKIYEGSLESYNVVTDMFKVVYENGCFDELKGNDLISYLVCHRNKDGGQSASPGVPAQKSEKLPCGNDDGDQSASPGVPAQQSEKLPCRNNDSGQKASPVAPAQPPNESPRGNKGGGKNASPSAPVQPSRTLTNRYATGKMATGDTNDKGRVRTRPLMMRAGNTGGSSQPRRARKHRAKSAPMERQTRENVNRTALVHPSSEVGIHGRGRKRALRMRAINASPPRPASKPKVGRSPRRSLSYEEYKESAYIYYSNNITDEDEDK